MDVTKQDVAFGPQENKQVVQHIVITECCFKKIRCWWEGTVSGPAAGGVGCSLTSWLPPGSWRACVGTNFVLRAQENSG